jgi:hypothetical protein
MLEETEKVPMHLHPVRQEDVAEEMLDVFASFMLCLFINNYMLAMDNEQLLMPSTRRFRQL